MTAQAPLHPDEQTTVTRAEQETAPLQADAIEPIRDSLPLLDHRTRGRAIASRLAPFGHYLALSEDGVEWLLPLDQKITHIGRGLASDLRVEDQRVSRNHAIVVRHGHSTRLLDNRSAHGTFVNGRRIIATNINHGDVIRLGPVVMTYVRIA